MELERIRDEKENLRIMLVDLINEFEKLTDVEVVELTLRRERLMGFERGKIYDVEVSCEV